MSDSYAIRVKGLSKEYVLGGAERFDETFREMIMSSLAAPFKRLKRLGGDVEASERFWALKDVSFDIKPGEVVGIIGRNGAGKSTLLKILSRITDPTEGRVEIKGRISSLLEVGTGFHPELTGRENIFLNGAILGMTRKEILSKFDEIVAFAEVERFLDTPVKRYSSGMYVRLAFAVAAHLEPEILIVDEVLAVGDAAFQKKCLGKMSDVASQGRTVLFVSHNMGAVRSLCSRVIMLNQGGVYMDSGINEGIEAYLSQGVDKGSMGEIVWSDEKQAPSCDEIVLRSIRVFSSGKDVLSLYDTGKPISIEISYDLKTSLNDFRVILNLLTREGTVAFSTTNHAIMADFEHNPGTYLTTCHIPANLLNEGVYLVSIRVGIPGVKVLLQDKEYLSITVESSSAAHGSTFSEKWPGVVAPKLKWQLRALS